MKRFACVLGVLLLLAVTSATQESIRIYTTPTPPSRAVLDRLRLTLAWRLKIPTEGRRDGIFSVQIAPGKERTQLLVQTYHGVLLAIDAETGDTLWRTQLGQPYWPLQPVAYNQDIVLAARRDMLFAVDRDMGQQVLWTIEKDSGLPVYGMPLEGTPSTSLIADNEMVYVPVGRRVLAYAVPKFRRLASARAREEPDFTPGKLGLPPLRKLKPSPQLGRVPWPPLPGGMQFQEAPRLTADVLCLADYNGHFVTLDKLEGKANFLYKVRGHITAGMAQHGSMIYVASEGYDLYAFNTDFRKANWIFTGGAPIYRKVEATDRDVYVAPERVGLYCLDRARGVERWLNRDADQFLATNYTFVYALDRSGRLLVLDYERGTLMALADTRDFTVPIPNDHTDRIYLAAHDGTIVCMHHSDHVRPLSIKTEQPPRPPVGKTVPPNGKGDTMPDEMKK